MSLCDIKDLFIVGRLTEKVHRNNRSRCQLALKRSFGQRIEGTVLRAYRFDSFFQQVRAHIEGDRIYVYENWGRPQQGRFLYSREKSEGRYENCVPLTDIPGHQGHEQGICARSAGDAVTGTRESTEEFFQLSYFRAHNVFSMIEDGLDAGVNVAADASLLGCEINKLHG